MSSIRTKLTTVAAICAAAIGGGAIANAATSTTASSTTAAQTTAASQPGGPQGRHTANGKTEAALAGDVAAKVRAAALAKVSGTVDRVEVQVTSDFTVAAVNTMGGHP
jgi:hypothetical protein